MIVWMRKNTANNAPAVIHTEIVPGDRIRLTVMPKGGGCENMSFLKMLTPSAGTKVIEDTVVEGIRKAGTNPCPPLIVGIGLGGSFEHCAFLAKKALLRTKPNKDSFYKKMEARLLKRINIVM